MTLHPYIDSPQASLRTLSTDFRGSSGGLRIQLPSTWEGEVTSHLSNGRVRHEWEGLRVLEDGPMFRAMKGNGLGKLNIWGNSMNVELVGERMPDLPREVGVKEKGEHASSSSTEVEVQEFRERASGLPTTVKAKEQGERVPVVPGMPGLPREVEVREDGERMPDLPDEEEWQEAEEADDDDDWTIVGNEDGAQEIVKRPPPTYEDATRT